MTTLPKTLDETYTRILEAIADDDREIAVVALQWLAFSFRPLTIEELAEATIVRPTQEPAVDINNRFRDPLDIWRILSSLATLLRQRNQVDEDCFSDDSLEGHGIDMEDLEEIDVDDFEGLQPSVDCFITLGHFSVKEYLVSNRLPYSVHQFTMNPRRVHKRLTQICLQYTAYVLSIRDEEQLSLEVPERSLLSGSRESSTSVEDNLHFEGYSCLEWAWHKKECDLDEALNSLIYQVLNSPSWNTLWFGDPRNSGRRLQNIMQSAKWPLFIAVYLNLDDVFTTMLAAGADPNLEPEPPARRPMTILEAAVHNGNERFAKLLIDSDSKVNLGRTRTSNTRYSSRSLHLALGDYRIDLVQLLIDSGSSTGSIRNFAEFDDEYDKERHKSPLEMAANGERWDIFEIILNKGQDVDLNHALEIAADKNNRRIIEDLIERGADVDAVVHVGVREGRIDLVRVLLDCSADVSTLR